MTKLAPALDAAITYAAHGLRPFPIKARSKAPATAHGFKDATLDGGVLTRKFIAAGADANVGIATGEGIIVVDLDGPQAEGWWENEWRSRFEEREPRTWVATSGRPDGGRHLYFKVDRPVKTRPQGVDRDGRPTGIGPKVDVKGEGGYVLAPPSIHPDGPTYAWVQGGPASRLPIAPAPAWLLALLDEPRRAVRSTMTQEMPEVVTVGQDDFGARQAATLAARGMPRPEARAALEAMVATRFAGGWAGLDSSRPWTRADVDRWLDGAYAKFYDPTAAKALGADARLQDRTARKGPAQVRSATKPSVAALVTDISQDNAESSHEAPKSVAELLKRDIPAPKWAIEGILPEGLTILGGKPKMGKSWLALGLLLAVVEGSEALASFRARPGDALYLSLEDNERRLQGRVRKLLRGHPGAARLDYATEWDRWPKGGERLTAWLDSHPEARLVVVDTFARVRPVRRRDGSVYDDDYAAIAAMKATADAAGVAILVIHHLRKMTSDDPLELVSGSMGLTGAADTVWILKRERGKVDAVLHITGRDVFEQELALRSDPMTMTWETLGNAPEVRLSGQRGEILKVLRDNAPRHLTLTDLADMTGRAKDGLKQLVWKMVQDGQVHSPTRGTYTVTEGISGDWTNAAAVNGQRSVNGLSHDVVDRVDRVDQGPTDTLVDHVLNTPATVDRAAALVNEVNAHALTDDKSVDQRGCARCGDTSQVLRRGRGYCGACGAALAAA